MASVKETSRSPGGTYKFPLDTQDRLTSRITFEAIAVDPPKVSVGTKATKEYDDEGNETGQSKSLESVSADVKNVGYRPLDEKAQLYLPISFQVNDGFNYQQANLNALGAAVATGLNSGKSITQAGIEEMQRGGQAIFDFFTKSAMSGEASRLAAVRATQAIPLVPDSVRSAVGITARITMNPNIRTMFNGVSVREFNFQFKFIPRSQQESEEVKKIIKFFRFHAYPTTIPAGKNGFSLAYNYPNMFKIKLQGKNQGGRYVNVGTPIKLCYLKSISSIYNPQTAVLHPDGSPVETDINLTFTEYKTQTRWDIENEDNEHVFDNEIHTPTTGGDVYSGGSMGGR